VPLVVGIDEAGYGPLLGPLVVGATVWQVSHVGARPGEGLDFWHALRDAVCRKPVRGDSRLPVDDSKAVYDRKRGISTLERTVLAFAAAAGLRCETVAGFLDALGSPVTAGASAPPWYQDLAQPLPLDPRRSGYQTAAARLARGMDSAGLRCVALLAQVVTEADYNARVLRTRNKAAVLLEQVLRLIQRATAACGDQDVCMHVDRLGGRQNYRALLLAAFPERHLHIEQSDETCSRYRLASQRSDWWIDFTVDADRRYLPVALASMVAKYVRELLMRQFNVFWRGLRPDLEPTAGYYRDALRFLKDIRPVLPRSGLRPEQFVRQR